MKPGEVVAERFEVAELAGQGGMGAVFRARDRLSGESVALKALTDPGGNHVERFLREAQVLQDLHHPGIVRYIAHGRAQSGELYMVMEWVDGESVSQRVARQPLTVPQATFIALQIAQGLAEAHRHGVVHRDIKPSNVFVHRASLAVKVLDFGIARLSEAARLTGVGMMLGTPGYMAPEQARGSSNIDARADVFSLGCLFFKCLTGRPPFMSEDVRTVLAQVLFDPAPVVSSLRPEVPPSLDALVARMLAKKPADRLADGAAVAAELELISVQLGPVAGTSPTPPPSGRDPTARSLSPAFSTPTPPPQRASRITGPRAVEIPIVATPPARRVAPPPFTGTELDMPVVGGGPPATEMEIPIQALGTAATKLQVPAVRLGPAGTQVEVAAVAVPAKAEGQLPIPAPAVLWASVRPTTDPATSLGPSPFASPDAAGTPAAAEPFAAVGAPAGQSTPSWDPPTFVGAAREVPEPPAVVEAFIAAQEAYSSDNLDGVLEATTHGLAAVAGPESRGRLLALQSEARSWRGQHEMALTASAAALDTLTPARSEWGTAFAVQARCSLARGDDAHLLTLASRVISEGLESSAAVQAAAAVATGLGRCLRLAEARDLEGRLASSPAAGQENPVARAAVLGLQAALAGARGDLSLAADLASSASNLLSAAGRLLASLEASLEAARWRARTGDVDLASVKLEEVRDSAAAQGARWLEVEATLSESAVAAEQSLPKDALRLALAAVERVLPAMGELVRGRVFLRYAEALALNNRLDESRVALQRAQDLPAGRHRAAAAALQSRVALLQGRKAPAVESAKSAAAYFDANPTDWEGELEARLALVRALFAGGLNDVGRNELASACARLKVQTAAISSAGDRSMFLTRLPEHRQLLELASWWLGEALG